MTRYSTLLLLAAAGLFAYLVPEFWPQTLDDSFITFRYSANAAAGHGPLWNPGLPPSEGYTSFLWMCVMVIPHLFEADAVVFSKVAGIVLVLACFAVTYAFTLRLCSELDASTRRIAAAAAVLFQASFYATAAHAVTGMETALYTFLLQLFFFSVTRAADEPTPRRVATVPVVSLLAMLTRPEAGLGVALALVVVWTQLEAESRRRLFQWTLGLLVAPWLIYYAWRFQYYGLPFPLPFYVKVVGDTPLSGPLWVRIYLEYIAIPLAIPVLAGFYRLGKRVLPHGVALAGMLIFYCFPSHVMGMDFRYRAPTLPMFAVLGACGLALLMERAPRLEPRWSRAIVVFVLCPAIAAGLVRGAAASAKQARLYARGLELTHIALGRKLATMRYDLDAPILAINDAGAVPYYSGWQAVDTVGLNEAAIALSQTRDPAYVLSKNPDLIVIPSYKPVQMHAPYAWQQALYRAALESGMTRVQRTGRASYHLWLMADPNGPVGRELSRWDPVPVRRPRTSVMGESSDP